MLGGRKKQNSTGSAASPWQALQREVRAQDAIPTVRRLQLCVVPIISRIDEILGYQRVCEMPSLDQQLKAELKKQVCKRQGPWCKGP